MSENFINKWNFFYLDQLDKNQPTTERYIWIRWLLYFKENNAFSASSMPGMIILFTLFRWINNVLLVFINPIFIFILFIYLFKIIRLFFGNISYKLWLVISIIIILSSQTIYNWSFLFNNLAATTLFVVWLYYLLQIDKSYKYWLLFSLFLGITMWFRYPIVIFYLPFVLYKFFPLLKKSYIYIIPFILFLIPLIYYQNIYFHGFLNFNNPTYRLNHFEKNIQNITNNWNFLSTIINYFNFKVLINNLINQFLKVNPIIILLFIIWILNIKNKNKNKNKNKIIFILYLLIVMQCIFYCWKIWSWYYFSDWWIWSSYTRYLFITWISIYVLSIYYLLKVNIKKRFKVIITSLLIIFNISYAINSQMGLRYFYSTSNTIYNIKNELQSYLPNKSIILTDFDDKYFYWLKNVKLLPYIAIPPNNYKKVINNYIVKNPNYKFYLYRKNKIICNLFECKNTPIKNLYKLSIKNNNEQN